MQFVIDTSPMQFSQLVPNQLFALKADVEIGRNLVYVSEKYDEESTELYGLALNTREILICQPDDEIFPLKVVQHDNQHESS